MEIEEIKDRIALRELVDRVSALADQKDFDAQVQLFTHDGISETIADGAVVLRLQGRKAMAEAFADYLKEVDSLFHLNGQQLLSIEGDKAAGICYCDITLVSGAIKTAIKAIYSDDYLHDGGVWRIAKRTGNFIMQQNTGISH